MFILLGCTLSGFQCSGDSMGGLMMVYGIIIFPFAVLIEVTVIIALLVFLVMGKAREVSNKLILLFSSTFLLSFFVGSTL
jgi:hypothetical protein